VDKLIQRYENIGESELSRVVTTSELARLYNMTINGVRYHIDEGNLTAVQTLDDAWLIWLPSAVLIFGAPPCPGIRCRELDFDDISGGFAGRSHLARNRAG
jgi:hypothetical protein